MSPSFPLLAVLFLLVIFGCEDPSPDMTAEQTAPFFNKLDFSHVRPGMQADYWELRYRSSGLPSRLIASGGPRARRALHPEAVKALDALTGSQWKGFGPPCGPIFCSYYVLVVQDKDVVLVETTEQLIGFLGRINSRVEALFLTYALGYYSYDTEQVGSIARIPGGYDITVFRRVSDCPIQIDRFHLELDALSGGVTIISQEVWEEGDGCI